MLTFKQYLAEGRSKPIDLQKAQEWMLNNAMDYLHHGTYLYRGIQGEDFSIRHANTAEGEPRKSIGGMANYYTLWMSHNPEWAGKPRRERSFIVSSSRKDAATWGKLHIVVPSNNSKIGAVGSDDIWNREIFDIRLARFTTQTRIIFERMDAPTKYDSYSELASAMKAISMDEIKEVTTKANYLFDANLLAFIHTQNNAKNLFDLWEIFFDPKHFDFMTPKNIRGQGEFWIDGEALYIPTKPALSDSDKFDMIAWAKKHAPDFADELRARWIYDLNV